MNIKYPRTKKQIILYKRLVKYCKQLGVTPIPIIAWSKNECIELAPKERKEGKNTLGRCFYRKPLIYIAYNKHTGIRELDNTLRHELIHYRFTGVPHGISFEKKMLELKRGKIWKAFDRLAWAKAFNLKWDLKIMESNFRYFISHIIRSDYCNCYYCFKARGFRA
jgi:hypothetical protein